MSEQAEPRVVASDKWPPVALEWDTARPVFVEPPSSAPVVYDPAEAAVAHVEVGRREIARLANASQVALTQLRAWLRADRNPQWDRKLSDTIYDLEGVLDAYPEGGAQ